MSMAPLQDNTPRAGIDPLRSPVRPGSCPHPGRHEPGDQPTVCQFTRITADLGATVGPLPTLVRVDGWAGSARIFLDYRPTRAVPAYRVEGCVALRALRNTDAGRGWLRVPGRQPDVLLLRRVGPRRGGGAAVAMVRCWSTDR